MKIQMTRLETVWFYAWGISMLVPTLLDAQTSPISLAVVSLLLVLIVPLGILRWNNATKERQKIEAKHRAQDAELLNQHLG